MERVKDVLLDSDVIIEFLRGNQRIRGQLRGLMAQGVRLAYTPVSIAEIHAGMRPGEEKEIEAFFAALESTPIDDEVAKKAGEYLRTYGKSHGVEPGDALVAAAASLRDLALWTMNRRHYPMPDVEKLEDGRR